MSEREAHLRRARTRLERWEEKLRKLRRAPMRGASAGRRMYDQCTQEVGDRLESARVKYEKMRRLDARRFSEVKEEFDEALAGLQDAWDMTVARISWSDPFEDDDAS
jgi:hypothetical protein